MVRSVVPHLALSNTSTEIDEGAESTAKGIESLVSLRISDTILHDQISSDRAQNIDGLQVVLCGVS